jgi:hypothetical protein
VDKFLVTNMIISIRTQTVEVYGQVIEEMWKAFMCAELLLSLN